MDLDVRWQSPLMLQKSKGDYIYEVADFNSIPEAPGVYVFARSYGDTISPLYVGKAINLRSRIDQQLNNLRLMRAIEKVPNGDRVLCIGEFVGKGGQSAAKAIALIESAFISTALVEGFEIINIKGTKTPSHTLTSSGNRESRSWLPESVIRIRKSK